MCFLAAEIRAAGGKAVPVAMDVTDPASVGRAFDAAEQALGQARQRSDELGKAVSRIAEQVDADIAASRHAFDQEVQRATWLFGLALAVVLVVVTPLTLLNSVSITRPLSDASALARSIADGDLTQKLNTEGGDEVAGLLRALARMQERLVGMVGEVRNASERIHSTSGEVASGNVDLSQRTELTAGNLQQAASSMEELTGIVGQSAEHASQASQMAGGACQVAQRGGEAVGEVVQTMDEINLASRRIADIIGVIDGIAFQTNILALNAAVEAAQIGRAHV